MIDCLVDGRVSKLRFSGDDITKPMNVPVGYICLDILSVVAPGKPASQIECPYDGLGVCMNEGFYFRPDDYFRCWSGTCRLRPWVRVVQENWRRQYLQHRLHFKNPYDNGFEEYKGFATPKK